MSWLRPANSSASDSLPSGPSKRYSALTSSQGRSRRAWLSASRSRVNAFSRTRSARRAFSHCSCETTLCLPLMPLDSCGAVNGGCSGADPGIQCPASYASVWLCVKRGAGAIPDHGGPGGPLTLAHNYAQYLHVYAEAPMLTDHHQHERGRERRGRTRQGGVAGGGGDDSRRRHDLHRHRRPARPATAAGPPARTLRRLGGAVNTPAGAKPIVLAYSGGLDTSFLVPWIAEHHQRPVITVTVDTGGIDAAAALALGVPAPAGARRGWNTCALASSRSHRTARPTPPIAACGA